MGESRKCRAAVLRAVGEQWQIEELTVDPPVAGEVIVQWKVAGLCHSDLTMMSSGAKRRSTAIRTSTAAPATCSAATEVNGKPRLFYIAPDEQGPAMQLWEGAGKPRLIGHLPAEE